MKKTQQKNPFVNQVLDAEERALEESFERGEFEEVTGAEFEKTKKMFEEASEMYRLLHLSKPITIRVNQLDLIKVKASAKRKQIPYQTLLGSLIHEYAEGNRDLSL
ncbi:MAG: hypothetical protein COY80_03350 [Candidatus Pacebacteria bacterium CG_4_10_14_0_8_um_filter_42_14]|nr:MAG: hypothetical protein COY80_03350 [Candidatus Pacebacteria bacterium CG_4_10_14_0_8_um_filter_42_14]